MLSRAGPRRQDAKTPRREPTTRIEAMRPSAGAEPPLDSQSTQARHWATQARSKARYWGEARTGSVATSTRNRIAP
jgi:hypothetical protein